MRVKHAVRFMPVVLATCLVAVACAGTPSAQRSSQPATARPAAPQSDSEPTAAAARRRPPVSRPRPPARAYDTPGATATPRAPTRPLTLAFAGDIHFEDHLRPLLDEPGTSLASLRPELASADLAIANLETAITTRGEAERKSFTFRAPASALEAVAGAGIDVVSMANNHGVDYGSEGLTDTLRAAARNAPVGVVGIGADEDQAFAPHVETIRGTKVAVIAADQVADPTTANFSAGPDQPGVASALDPARLLAAVRAARRAADVVVVYLHWGVELEGCPTDDQRSLARQLADAGADVVAGTHAHVQLGAGQLAGYDTFVAYGLGNFVWYNRSSERTTTTGVLTLSLDGRTVTRARWAPASVGPDGVPEFASGEDEIGMRRDWARLRECTDLKAVPEPPV
jgi:poly-gamma-glutamate capsule biosynthesis protein CapA/YwtB (metallophosphatase superfamily)